jgi:hypothetical protein
LVYYYGTLYWLVADLSKQNGSVKMALSTAKKELEKKTKGMLCLQERSTIIMAWQTL